MNEDLKRIITQWKMKGFRTSDIPYTSAVYSLQTDAPLVELKRTGPAEWTLCCAGAATPAVLCHAGVFADADDYFTGNLVIDTKTLGSWNGEGAEISTRLSYASYRCNYSYAFDTQNDSDFYDLQKELENYVQTVPGFNPEDLVRRSWQSGGSSFANLVFWMKTPMFLRHPPGERKPRFPKHLHTWVRQAEYKARKYRANPHRPSVRAIEEGRLKSIAQCTPDKLREGDGVAVSFTIKYLEGETDWYPQYLIIDIVRIALGTPPRTAGATYGAVAGSLGRDELQDGEIVDGGPFVFGVDEFVLTPVVEQSRMRRQLTTVRVNQR
ncbi:hypothetical protein C8Q76DRAFT_633942 [Earliella scabrosa]|nr:hypothetical protein C8Q76DRAFT_633942 [Earliella scabrosa]